jgi:hypothetical protein
MNQPIQPELRALMNDLAAGIDKILNGEAKGDQKRVGFCLLTFNFGQISGGRVNYISNAERADMIAAAREWLARAEGRVAEAPETRQ